MLKWRVVVGVLLVLVPLLASSPAFPAGEKDPSEGPVDVEADNISYDGEQDTVHASGNVLITFTGGYLKADRATIFRATNKALAEGNVFLKSDQDLLEGRKVLFDTVTKIGTVDDGKMFLAQNHYYIRGEKIEKKGPADYRLEKGTITTCDGDNPDWSIVGSQIDLTVDGYGTITHGRLRAGDYPIFYTPYMVFPAKTKRQSGLLFPSLTYSRDKNGLDIELPFYWAISESTDATFYQRYMSQRGFKEGVEFRYYPSIDTFGTFYVDFINDTKQVKETVGSISRDWQESQKRWSFYLNHETSFSPTLSIRSDIRRVSDHWYFKDFSTSNYYLNNYAPNSTSPFPRISFVGDESLGALESTVRLTKNWSLYNLTAVARYTDDLSSQTNDATLQKYPEVILTGFRQPLFSGSPLQYTFSATYDNFYRQEGQKGHLWEIAPTFYWPLKWGPYLQATPQVGFTGSLWDRTDNLEGRDKKGDREVFQTGATLSSEISRVFNVNAWGVDKIQHAIRPEVTYTYIPEASQGYLPDYMSSISAANSLTYALINTVTSRLTGPDGKKTYRQLMRLKLYQTYDIRESRRDVTSGTADNRPFSDVGLEFDFAPLPNLSMAARNVYSVNSGIWKQTNYDLSVSDKRGDSATLGYRYTQDSIEEINLALRAPVTPALDVAYVLRRNLLDRKTIDATYGIRYKKQCWIFELNVSDTSTDRAFMFYISLLGLGRTGGGVSLSTSAQ